MDTLDKMSDEALCQAAAQGTVTAEETLVLRYRRLVRVCARPYFLLGGDSEDLVQEGMVGLLKAIRSYRAGQGASFHTYAEHCINHALISAVRAAARQKHIPLNTYVSFENPLFDKSPNLLSGQPALQQMDPEALMIGREEVKERLDAIRSQLSHFEAKILGLYLNGLSYSEIASQVNRPVKAVDNAVQRIRRKLSAQIFHGDVSES
jgi:RNA polymerase sporulation-specific sigma factor